MWIRIKNSDHLGIVLDEMIRRMQLRKSETYLFAEAQKATGLRSIEVLERERWVVDAGGKYSVQLAKKGDVREFAPDELPEAFKAYISDKRNPYPWTYSSYLHDLIKTGIAFKFTGVKKSTYSHAFRYHMFRKLQNEGLGLEEIQEHMHHAATGSSLYYLLQAGYFSDLHQSLE